MKNNYEFLETDQKNNILINSETGFWMVLNKTAKIITEKFLYGLNEKEIIDNLQQFYDLPKNQLSNDVHNCVDLIKMKFSNFDKNLNIFLDNNLGLENLTLTIHITNQCNLKCPYCFANAQQNKGEIELSITNIVNCINTAIKKGAKKIVFSGGEPTLRKDFYQLLLAMQDFKESVSFSIITNGTTVLENDCFELMCKTFDIIQISIDSYCEEKNAATRGKGSFEKVLNFVSSLRENNYSSFYYATTPYTSGMNYPSTINDLPQMLRLAANTGALGLYVNHLKPEGRMKTCDYIKFNEEEYWENADKLYEEYYLLSRVGFNEKDMGKNFTCFVASDQIGIFSAYSYKTNCGLGVNELALDCQGNVYPCSSLMESNFLIGNIFSEKLEDIIDNAKEIYSNNDFYVDSFDDCKECYFKRLCGGGCRAMAYYSNGNITSKDPNCSYCKKRILKWMDVSLAVNINDNGDGINEN